MPDTFVKYTPAVEQADPDFDKNLQTVIEATKQYIQNSVKSEGLNRAVRDAHAKSYGLTKAEVEILGGLAPEYAQGIYALPGRATDPAGSAARPPSRQLGPARPGGAERGTADAEGVAFPLGAPTEVHENELPRYNRKGVPQFFLAHVSSNQSKRRWCKRVMAPA